MEIRTAILNLVKALDNQGYSFSESLFSDAFRESFDFQSGATKKFAEALQSINKHIVSYDHIDKNAFARDLSLFQQSVDQRMLMAWGYKSGCLSIIGIMYADDLSNGEITSLFSRFDNGVTNIMRRHVGHVSGGNDGGTYGTMMLVFADSSKAAGFNSTIRNYYNSHFFKSTYVSTMGLDCSSQTLTQGKGPMGCTWQGGMDVSVLKSQLFV